MIGNQEQILGMLMGTTVPSTSFLVLLTALSVWSLVWKGIALWKASHNNSKPWFIALLIINTAGILEIIYIFFFADKKNDKKDAKQT